MKRIELITSKEYWVETLEALQQLGHSDYEIATVIANKMTEAMNYIPCCKSDSGQLAEVLCKNNQKFKCNCIDNTNCPNFPEP